MTVIEYSAGEQALMKPVCYPGLNLEDSVDERIGRYLFYQYGNKRSHFMKYVDILPAFTGRGLLGMLWEIDHATSRAPISTGYKGCIFLVGMLGVVYLADVWGTKDWVQHCVLPLCQRCGTKAINILDAEAYLRFKKKYYG